MRALVTGGSSGLGAALVERLLARGDEVLVCDLNAPESLVSRQAPRGPTSTNDAATSLVEEVGHDRLETNLHFLRLDVRSDDDWEAALAWVEEHWGGLDLLVNNAGVAGGGRIDVATLEEWEWITEINLFGVVRGCRTFVPMLKAQGSGQIVNVASLAGLVHPAGMASYNAVKAGVVALSETLSHELASWDIKVAVVCPSYFRTNLMDSLRGADSALGGIVSGLVERSPFSADDIARAVLDGIAAGDEVIVPDPAARQAYDLKRADRAAYDAVMRAQAAKLREVADE